jgi:hypothetical protein
MNVQKLNVFVLPLLAAVLLTTGSVLAQGAPREVARPASAEAVALPRPVACPAPFNVTLNANAPYVLPSDVPSGANYQTSLNYTGTDKTYLHTFVWKHERRCCQVTSAVLTVHMKALQSGQSNTSSDAGNDNITLWHAGQVVQPYNERIYGPPYPFPAGQTATKTWTLNATALGILNSTGALTFGVEDDTSVTSATLQLTGCCLAN